MRIGILTLHNAHNYGAALQCFALREYLQSLGHDVQVIDYRIPAVEKLYRLRANVLAVDRAAAHFSKPMPGRMLLSGYVNRHSVQIHAVWKYRAFIRFQKHFHLTARCDSMEKLRTVCQGFDALVAGSDQIWNPAVTGGFQPAFFLPFGREGALRFSYAASIGAAEIAPEKRELYRFWLRGLDAISVREASGCAQIAALTDKPVAETLDPVFLLSEKQRRALEVPFPIDRPYLYVHNVHLTQVDERLNAMVEAVSSGLGLNVVSNRADSRYQRQIGVCCEGPGEFLGCISGAAFVITNSFHATVLSILYHKQFITVPHQSSPERVLQILDKFGLGECAAAYPEELPQNLENWIIDYRAVEARLAIEKRKSEDYLQKTLAAGHRADTRSFLQTRDDYRCFGCGACQAVCAAKAITMQPDSAGFRYPHVDPSLCTRCGRCENACPHGRLPAPPSAPRIYAARNKCTDEIKTSTSGAVFPVLAEEMIRRGGKVIGVCYNSQMRAIYAVAGNEEECRGFKGSKYVEADNEGILVKAKAILGKGTPLLFSGTPCQIAALQAYLSRPYKNLYTVNVLCMGVGAPQVFEQYRDYISAIYRSKLIRYSSRADFRGQKQHYVELGFASGASLLEQAKENGYLKLYRGSLILRPSCYACPFKPMGGAAALSPGDITLGDFWRIEKTHPNYAKGGDSSLLQVNTQKGREMFEAIRNRLQVIESTEQNGYRIYTRILPVYTEKISRMRHALRNGDKLYE